MFVRKGLVALAWAGLLFGSPASAAAPAVADVRAASPVAKAEGIRANSWMIILGLVILFGALGIALADGDDAVSP